MTKNTIKKGHGLELCHVPKQVNLAHFEEVFEGEHRIQAKIKAPVGEKSSAITSAADLFAASTDAAILITGIQYRFKCTGCGSCCTVIDGVEVLDRDIPDMALALEMDISAFKDRYLRQLEVNPEFSELERELEKVSGPRFELRDGHPCQFFDIDAKRCKVYDARPAGCRGKPFVTGDTLDFDPRSRTIIIRNVPLCSASSDHLKKLEKDFKNMRKILRDRGAQWTEETANEERRMGMLCYRNALLFGKEDEIGTLNGLAPRDAAFILASCAYYRLISSGWKVIFDTQGIHPRVVVDPKDLLESLPDEVNYSEKLFGNEKLPGSRQKVEGI
jgi:Fe-S-cluster containining protein